jgi:DNA polymerase-1
MKLFIDADYIVYKSCAAAETEIDWGDDVILVTSKFSDAIRNVKREIVNVTLEFGGFAQPVLFFSDSKNFRKDILPTYKGHRNRKKPCGYKRVINELMNEYRVILLPTLEADDAMGIYATKYPGNIIVSPDKDMRQIPGELYNLEERVTITPYEGAKWHLVQTLAGDQTDGYSGAPGIGVKRAESLFELEGYTWKTVVKAFAEKGLDESVALQNARLARILTNDDYDSGRNCPILWTPSPDYRIDDGTAIQDSEDEGPTT